MTNLFCWCYVEIQAQQAELHKHKACINTRLNRPPTRKLRSHQRA